MPVNNSYESVISAKSPKIWFRFNETAGTPVNSGSLSCTLTAFGTPQLNNDSSVDGRSVSFPNTGSYYTLTNFPAFSLFDDRSFTVETWFKMATRTDTLWPALFSFGTPGYSGQFFFARLLGTNSSQVGRLDIGFKPANGYSEYKNYTSQRVDDNKWHHLVVTVNTTSMKTYIDGALSSSSAITTPASIDFDDSSTEKYFGTLGTFDEFAMYDRELTAAEINANYVAGNAVYFNDIPGTASALMVQPTFIFDTNPTISPMTANASLPLPNATMNPKGLDAKLSEFSLPIWYKFNLTQGHYPYNNGTGSQPTSVVMNPTSTKNVLGFLGPNGTSAAKLHAELSQGSIAIPDTSQITSDITGKTFSIGAWFKIDGTENIIRRIFSTIGGTTSRIFAFTTTAGYISFTYQTSAGANNYTGSTDLRGDGLWHYAAIRVNDTDVRYYLDGVEVYATTVTGSRTNPNGWRIGQQFSDNSDTTLTGKAYVSNFYVASHSEIDATDIDDLWDASRTITEPVQGVAQMVGPVVRFNNAFNDKLAELNANFVVRLDTTGTTQNFGTGSYTFTEAGPAVTKGIATKNRYGYQWTQRASYIQAGLGNTNFKTTNGFSLVTYAKIPAQAAGEDVTIIWAGTSTGSFYVIGTNEDGPYFALGYSVTDRSNWQYIRTNDTSLHNDYHLYGITRDTGDVWKVWIDGKLIGSATNATYYGMPQSSAFIMGDVEGINTGSTESISFFIDEAAFLEYHMSAQQMFELWQSLAIDGPGDVTSTFVMPAIAQGTGPTINAAVSTASTLFVDPALSTETNELAEHMEAFGVFVLPNYGASVNVDSLYGHSAFTASALFHMPQFSIGEFNSVDYMNASALMVNPLVITPGAVTANPGVAINATLVMPGIVTIKGARVFAETLTARASLPLPPAYVQLTDDPYYVRLFSVHSQQSIEAKQAFDSPGAATDVARSFLKFFNDVTLDITVGSTRYLTNEMPNYVYDPIGTVYTDNNGNIIPPNTTKSQLSSSATRGSTTPTPIVSKGYFDAWDRKAVNFSNIEFNFGTDSQYHSKRQYSVEFTIKTTKSNQILTYGNWSSFYYYQRSIGTIGLFNGKLYSMDSYQNIGKADVIPHPANRDALTKAGLKTGYMLGNKRIDDGEWHHIVIQYGYEDNRTQYWIDGTLDRQMIGSASAEGSNGFNEIRPFIVGFNSNDSNLYSDFQTSAWSWTPNKFLSEQDIKLNYEAAYKYSPIFAEPMLATATATDKNYAEGNRGRALMLYWWPTNTAQRYGNYEPTFDTGRQSFDYQTFDPNLDTIDYFTYPPQEFEGWDVFPVDVTGYFVSDLVKVEAYGGPGNIGFGDAGGAILTTGDLNKPQWKFNSRRTFRDKLTDAPRYIDLINDIDLTQFDAIFFKNFPDQGNEIERYAKDEVVDSYFRIRELKIYEDFIKSLRKAVDTGISLYVTNTELALDLGIINRIDIVPDLDENVGYSSDPYAPTIAPGDAGGLPISTGDTVNVWLDTYKNNRLRLVKEVDGMTNFPTVIQTDTIYWRNDDQITWAGADRAFTRLVYKPNGLSVGDEWIHSNYSASRATYFSYDPSPGNNGSYQAVPFENIIAGKPVVAFANQVRKGLDLIDNPYKNHATAIIVEPGDRLNGSLCGGKIFVNFTEYLYGVREDFGVDLIQNYWIDYAEDEGIISADRATNLRNATYNIDRRLAAGEITQAQYNDLAFWSSNGNYILQQNNPIPDDSDSPKGGGVTTVKGQRTRRINKQNKISFQSVAAGSQWFSTTFAWQYPRITVHVPSMLTRGFWWVSNKEIPDGTLVGVVSMNASATFASAQATPDKIVTVNAQAMVGNARITEAFGYTPNSINNLSLPMEALARMTDKVFRIDAAPMLVSALMPQNARVLTSSVDEVIVYIMYEDATLYLREEVIK